MIAPPHRLRPLRKACLGLCLVVMLVSVRSGAQVTLLELNDQWRFETQGSWGIRKDHRDLLAMRHPWTRSNKGDFALAWRTVTIPKDWTTPISLVLYCSDDCHAEMPPPDAPSRSTGFHGKRFKQVLADAQVVWSEDVTDPVVDGTHPPIRIPMDLAPGQSFRLSLLVYDMEASDAVRPGRAPVAASTEDDDGAGAFMSNVYWGDLALVQGDAMPPPGRRPAEEKVLEVHGRRWPLTPFGDGWKDAAVRLECAASAPIPVSGFPVQMGIPFPAGKVKQLRNLRFQMPGGKAVPVQLTALAEWPDASIRWALADFKAAPEMEALVLYFNKDTTSHTGKIRFDETDERIQVNAGSISFTAQTGEPIRDVLYKKSKIAEKIQLSLVLDSKEVAATAHTVHVLDEGPFRCTLAIEGRFDAIDRSWGSFMLHITAYDDLPFIRLSIRLFNDTADNLQVRAFPVVFMWSKPTATYRVCDTDAGASFNLHQTDANTRKLNNGDIKDKENLYVVGGNVTLIPRQFRELYPKRIQAESEKLVIDLAAGGNNPVVFTPGESKTHELWLAFDAEDPAALAALVAQPPILQNPDYYCATGVIGPARPHAGVPKLGDAMQARYADKDWAALGQHFGIRHFPDSPHFGGLPNWSNNYYERMLGLWSEWFMSGDRVWYDRAMDVCRHIMDTAIVHSEVPGRDWLGAMHGPGNNHVGGPWNPALRVAGLELFHKMTGDPEAPNAFLGVADYCIRRASGMNEAAIRQHAGPFDAICTAYWDAGDPACLDDGALRVERVLQRMDRRRGAWLEAQGGTPYRGTIPWMAAQLARPLYWWYAMTGDVDAAQALAGLAEAVICENTDWDAPGNMRTFSYDPAQKMTARYDLLVLPMILAAYELTEDTFFRDAARAQWDRWTQSEEFDSVFNSYWNTPWLMWQLRQYGLLGETDPAP